MQWKRGGTAVVASLALLVGAAIIPTTAQSSPEAVGLWLAPFSENHEFDAAPPADEAGSHRYPTAVSAVVLPDGNVVFWNGLEDTEDLDGPIAASGGPADQTSKTRHLDLSQYYATGDPANLPAGAWSKPTPEDGGGGDLFCADQRLLSDGTVLAAGGSLWTNEDEAVTTGTPLDGLGRTELWGRKNTRIYNPRTNAWTQSGDMNKGRWYPAIVTLGDGRLFVAGGVGRLIYNSSADPNGAPSNEMAPVNVRETEYYSNGAWSVNTNDESKTPLPLFARLHLLPNGKVLYDSTGQTWGPFGEDANENEWDQPKWFDTTTDSWETPALTGANLGTRNGVFSIMMPLKPPYSSARVMLAGGTLAPGGLATGTWLASSMTEFLDWNGGSGLSRTLGPALNNMRWYSSGVLLPSGEVIALNGADVDEVVMPGIEHAVRQAEMYDPAQDKWIGLSSGLRDRTYHNSAVLLKDGTILVGGHSPIVAGYGSDHQTVEGFANNFKDPSFEIFKPPYLFRGTRPTITSALPSQIARGSSLTIGFGSDTAPASGAPATVVLSRLPGTTHVTDADQRTVVLETTSLSDSAAGGAITAQLPSDASVLPPGYYYVFLNRTNAGQSGPTVQTGGHIIRVL